MNTTKDIDRVLDQYGRVALFEMLWGVYIDKLARLDELKRQGRYGYQLRQPHKAIKISADALKTKFPEECRGLVN